MIKMKLIIVGGLGYVGSVLCKLLDKANIQYFIFDNNFYNLDYKKDFVKVDIRDKAALEENLKKYDKEADAIVNLAAVVGDPACLLDTKTALEINCIGTRNLVEFANKYNKRILHASSCSLYGAEKCSMESPLTEESPMFPVDFYGLSKLQQEKFVSDLAKDYCIFRLGTAFGQSDRMRYDLVINTFAAKTAKNESIIVFGGNQYRPFTHVEDIARAFIHAYKKNINGIYNLSGFNITIKDLALLFEKNFNSKVEISPLIQDPRNYIVDNAKLLKTGFMFESNTVKDIKAMIEEAKKIDYKETRYSNRDLMHSKIDHTNKEKKIVITGGNGILGSACKKIMPNALFPTRNELDVKDSDSIEKYFSQHVVETVIHLAALTGIPACEQNREEAYDINVRGTRRIIETSKKYGVKHFIYLSTACVFPGTDEDLMYDEDMIPYPKNFYALTKLMAEEITKSYNSESFLATVTRTNFSSMPWPYPKAFTDRFGTYLFAEGVANGLKDVALKRPKMPIIHICGNKKLSMYDYAVLGGSKVEPMTLNDYKGAPLTKNMCLTSKYWKVYDILDFRKI